MSAIRHVLRAWPTLLRVGLSEVVAYRAEFLVWILTTNLPLVQLALWNAVTADGPVGRFGQTEFRLYFVATLLVRLVTGLWVVWQLNFDIRNGTLAARLLRPMHPLLSYAAQHLAAVPIRIAVVSPLFLVLLAIGGRTSPLGNPATLAAFALSLCGAWLIVFLVMVIIGSLALWIESAVGIYELWMGVHAVLSGYLVPVQLLPAGVRAATGWMPFWFSLGFPVETLVGGHDAAWFSRGLAGQWAWVAVLGAATAAVWRAGQRRMVAYGG